MSHYTIDYAGLDPIAAHNHAIEDIEEYLGTKKFKELNEMFKPMMESLTLEQFMFYASFPGIQGYAAKAWYNYLKGL